VLALTRLTINSTCTHEQGPARLVFNLPHHNTQIQKHMHAHKYLHTSTCTQIHAHTYMHTTYTKELAQLVHKHQLQHQQEEESKHEAEMHWGGGQQQQSQQPCPNAPLPPMFDSMPTNEAFVWDDASYEV